ncbi:MAG TPA: cytochrome c3 family protein [Anaerolineales bacterium]|nr:cytochrome c3 family protein [Anaerolineales bacterium]
MIRRAFIFGPLAALLFAVARANAAPPQQIVGNDTCLACHGQPGLTLNLEDGTILELVVDPQVYAASIHGRGGYACVQCHTNLGDYPHPPFSAKDRRDAAIQLYTACRRCHIDEYERTLDSVHEVARASGTPEAAICTDCHTAHATLRLTDPTTRELLPQMHTRVPQICAQCHSAIYQKYLTSVHGSALTDEANPDVPTCIDCHGVHNIEDPTTAAFRLKSPTICARCHTDPVRMARYGLSTQVLETYVADFHGTTVTLFEKLSPDAETNKPVCYDCHGVHDIQRIDDPQKGLQVRENLLARCQRCHPDATANFPDAWLSHYIPSAQDTPLVFSVRLFYRILIPGLLGGMAILVALDWRWRRARRRGAQQPSQPAPPAGPKAPPTEAGPAQSAEAAVPAAPPQSVPPPPPSQTSEPSAETERATGTGGATPSAPLRGPAAASGSKIPPQVPRSAAGRSFAGPSKDVSPSPGGLPETSDD